MSARRIPKAIYLLASCLLAGCAGSNTVGFGSIGFSGFGVASETPLDAPGNPDPQSAECAAADTAVAEGCEAQPQPSSEKLPETGTAPE